MTKKTALDGLQQCLTCRVREKPIQAAVGQPDPGASKGGIKEADTQRSVGTGLLRKAHASRSQSNSPKKAALARRLRSRAELKTPAYHSDPSA